MVVVLQAATEQAGRDGAEDHRHGRIPSRAPGRGSADAVDLAERLDIDVD